MPRSPGRSRSRSPRGRGSASPPRRPRPDSRDRRDEGRLDDRRPRQRRPDAGFRWKDNKRRDNNINYDRDNEDRRDRGLDRGYRRRSRSPRRDRERNRDGGRDRDRDRDRGRDQRRDQARERDLDVADKFGLKKEGEGSSAPSKKLSGSTAPKIAPAAEPMIIVHVNDRLGTKAAIPCLASDKVGLFKAMVAARVGREPHEILLKRQGERPFKDQLTLEDYGVSNGVQLDLEVDTGD